MTNVHKEPTLIPQKHLSIRTKLIGALLLLAAVVFFVYSPALKGDFVNWDDKVNFLDNTNYRGLGGAQLKWMWTNADIHYIPVTWMSLGLDFVLYGMDPAGYHLTNVLLHVANSVVFFLIAFMLLRTNFSRLPKERETGLTLSASVATLFFAIHPLRAETVGWITERRGLLCGFFLLLSVLFYLRFAIEKDIPVDSRGMMVSPRLFFWAAVMMFVMSLLSKPVSAPLPAVLLLLDIYPLRRLDSGRRWTVLREKIPFLLVAVSIGIATIHIQSQLGGTANVQSISQDPSTRIALASFSAVFHLWKTLLPFGLAPVYEPAGALVVSPLPVVLCGTVLVGITLILFSLRKRWPAGLTVWAYFFLMLLPHLGLTNIGSLTYDRYSYLPSLGWALLIGGAFRICLGLFHGNRPKVLSLAGVCLVFISVHCWLGFKTREQISIWHNSKTLWEHTLRLYPWTTAAHNNLGNVLALENKKDEAIFHYLESIRANPNQAKPHNNLGVLLASQGRIDEAIGHYRQALYIKPNFQQAARNLNRTLTWKTHLRNESTK